MTRRKLCVVCVERTDEGKGWPRWCMKCSWLWSHSRAKEDRVEWAARRARAFERRRWKARGKAAEPKRVRRAERTGLTQVELAKRAGVSQSALSKLETGTLSAQSNVARKVAFALDTQKASRK